MSKNGGTYVELGNELDASLRALCVALNGANKSLIIRNALRQYIQLELQSNDGVRKRYEEILQHGRRVSSANLTVIE